MRVYKVTIHEHTIYDHIVEAENEEEARELAEESIISEEKHLWREDRNASWTDIGDISSDEVV